MEIALGEGKRGGGWCWRCGGAFDCALRAALKVTELGEDGGGPEDGCFGEALGGDPEGCAVDVDEVGSSLLCEACEEEGPVLGAAGDCGGD